MARRNLWEYQSRQIIPDRLGLPGNHVVVIIEEMGAANNEIAP